MGKEIGRASLGLSSPAPRSVDLSNKSGQISCQKNTKKERQEHADTDSAMKIQRHMIVVVGGKRNG